MPKYVVSSTLARAEWNNSTVLRGDLAEEVAKLKQGQDGDIVVHGSARLVQALIEHDLVDELRLMLFPVVLGADCACSARRATRRPCGWPSSKAVGDGVLILVLQPAEPGGTAGCRTRLKQCHSLGVRRACHACLTAGVLAALAARPRAMRTYVRAQARRASCTPTSTRSSRRSSSGTIRGCAAGR